MTTPRTSLPPFLLGATFFLATGAAWCWYNVSPKQFPVSYRFQARIVVPGWTFVPEPVSEQARDILATTNLFNGNYTNARGDRVTVFIGTWDANNPQQMAVVGHTPDICWVGAGWEPIAGGHPDKINLQLGTNSLPFEARTFLTPDKRSRELAAWCVLVSGQVFEEDKRFEIPEQGSVRSAQNLQKRLDRRTLKSKLAKVFQRIPATGAKQFIRFSTSANGSPATSLDLMQTFGAQWLDLQVSTPGM